MHEKLSRKTTKRNKSTKNESNSSKLPRLEGALNYNTKKIITLYYLHIDNTHTIIIQEYPSYTQYYYISLISKTNFIFCHTDQSHGVKNSIT